MKTPSPWMWLAAALALAPQSSQAREVLLPPGATWQFLDTGEQAPSGWQGVGFDASSWRQGPAQLGYGEQDERTIVTRGERATYRTTYLRTTFNVEDPNGATGVVLDLLADKGTIVYLNGEEVYRGNMQPRQLARYEAFAIAHSQGWISGIPIDASQLRPGTNSLAVEFHQDDPVANTMSFDARLELVRAGEAALLNGPWVTQVTETSARILWETDAPTDTSAQLGLTAAYGQTFQGRNGTTLHQVEVGGLTPGTRYHYRPMGSQGALASDSAFTTSPLEGKPFTWIVYGDSRSSPERHSQVVASAVSQEPDLIITTGDMVEAGQLWSQWQEHFFGPAEPLLRTAAILPVVGNHDSELLHPGSHFWEYFPNGENNNWYSIRYGDVELFVIDTSHAHGRASRQVAWLEDALASSTAPVLVVAHHYPVFSSGKHGSDPFAIGSLLPLYEQYGVSLVLTGHDHNYEHSYKDGVNYVLAGGGGASLYDVNDSWNPYQVIGEKTLSYAAIDYNGRGTLTVTAYRSDGSLIESFSVTPGQ